MTKWRRAAQRRSDMQGIATGVDRDSSVALLYSGKLDPHQKGSLRTILSGGVWTKERAHRANLAPSAVCQFCTSGEVEDHDHLWWRCAAWEPVRRSYPVALRHYRSTWPCCLRICGIAPSAGVDFDASEDAAHTTNDTQRGTVGHQAPRPTLVSNLMSK